VLLDWVGAAQRDNTYVLHRTVKTYEFILKDFESNYVLTKKIVLL